MAGLLAMFLVFYWGYSNTKQENRKLKDNGASINGVVYDVRVDRRLDITSNITSIRMVLGKKVVQVLLSE